MLSCTVKVSIVSVKMFFERIDKPSVTRVKADLKVCKGIKTTTISWCS